VCGRWNRTLVLIFLTLVPKVPLTTCKHGLILADVAKNTEGAKMRTLVWTFFALLMAAFLVADFALMAFFALGSTFLGAAFLGAAALGLAAAGLAAAFFSTLPSFVFSFVSFFSFFFSSGLAKS
jgi:hypothetical protein